MSTVWWKFRHGKHLIKIVRKYNNGNNKVFFDECGKVYYTHQSINVPVPFWIEKSSCEKTIFGSPNTYFFPKVYYLQKGVNDRDDYWVNKLISKSFDRERLTKGCPLKISEYPTLNNLSDLIAE